MKQVVPHSLVLLLLLAVAGWAAEPPTPEGGPPIPDGIIPQIATGGGAFFMDFQFVNASGNPASVTISFFDSDGMPMAVPYIQDGAVTTATTLIETVSPRGIEFARTVVDAEDTQIGYAEVESTPPGRIAVQSTFNQVVEGRPLFQAYIPTATNLSNAFFLPAVTTAGQTGSMAVVSLTAQNVTYTARNLNGVELCNAGRPFLAGEHRAFILRDILPCLAGVRGIVEVRGASEQGLLFGVGITAQDDGAFVTQPPVFAPAPLVF